MLTSHILVVGRLTVFIKHSPLHGLIDDQLDGWSRRLGLVHLKIGQKLERSISLSAV